LSGRNPIDYMAFVNDMFKSNLNVRLTFSDKMKSAFSTKDLNHAHKARNEQAHR